MPTPSPTIRLFVSSTFSDLKAERDALQREVFPRLKQLCLSKGLRFQAIDLRWGISEEAGRDNRTMRICLRELRRCQQDRPKPNFLILLGDRYGWRPLPEIIPATLFERLREHLTPENVKQILNTCYLRDDNAVPPIYELQPRGDNASWHEQVEKPLLAALEQAALTLGSDLDAEGVTIGASATEQEIIEGALKVPDAATHVRAFFRTIEGLPNPAPEDYVETGEAANRLNQLKDRISKHIGDGNVCRYRVPWRGDGINADDLKEFCEQAWKQLSGVVEQQIAALAKVPPDEQEEQAHQDFGKERCRRLVGRAEPLERIATYLRQGSGKPLAVIGLSGSGKSAVMAKAVEKVTSGEWRVASGKPENIYRFIGATPASSDLIQLLRNLVGEIRKRYPAPVRSSGFSRSGSESGPDTASEPPEGGTTNQTDDSEIPFECNLLVNAFHEALKRPTADRPLFLFLDALDQLTASHNAHSLAWMPGSLTPHVRLIVSAALPASSKFVAADVSPLHSLAEEVRADSRRLLRTEGEDPRAAIMSALTSRLAAEQRLTLAPLTVADGEQMLTNWLADSHRTLQPVQRQAILKTFKVEGNPLWLRTAAEEAARLASWQPAPSFAPTTPELLGQVLDRLSREEEHGDKLLSRTLSYLACARHGLAEDEILDILSADKEVMADFRRRSPNSPKVDSLPVAVWVRLHGDLAFYLAEHQAQGASLLGFYHRSFLEAVAAHCFASRETRETRHQHMSVYFLACAKGLDPAKEWETDAVRGFAECVFHLVKAGQHERAAALVSNFPFLLHKLRVGLLQGVFEDYDLVQVGHGRRAHRTSDDLNIWADFFREKAHILRRGNAEWPSYKTLLQLAVEHADDSPLTIGAERWLAGHRCDWLWLRRTPRLPHAQKDPCLVVLEEHTGAVEGALVLAGGRLVSWSADTTLRVWNGQTGKCLAVLTGHTAAVRGALVLADGRLLSWSYDGTLRVWNGQTGECLAVLAGHTYSVKGALALADGRLVSWSEAEDTTLRVWNGQTGECLSVLAGHTSNVAGALALADERLVSWSYPEWSRDTTLRVWNAQTGECQAVLAGHTAAVRGALALADGRLVSWDTTLRVWNGQTGECLAVLTGHTAAVMGALVLADGRLLSWSYDGTLRVWNGQTGECLAVLAGHTETVNGALVLADGRLLSWSWDTTLRVWNAQTGECLAVLAGHTETVNGALVLGDERLLSWSRDTTLRVWNGQTGKCLAVLAGHAKTVNGALALAHERLVSWSWHENTLRVWNGQSGACLVVLAGHTREVKGALALADGRLVSWSWDTTLRVWNGQTGECLSVLAGHTAAVWGALVLADGRLVSWGGSIRSTDHTLRLWDAQSGACLAVLAGHTETVEGALALADGRLLSWSADTTLRVWNAQTGECLAVLAGHTAAVWGALALADGRLVSWAGRDTTLRVWNGQTGECLAVLAGHASNVAGALALADERLVSWSEWDKTLRLWDVQSGACLEVVPEAQVGRQYPELLHARAKAEEPGSVAGDFLGGSLLCAAHLRFKSITSALATWQADSDASARCLLPDGTLVVTQANGQVCLLKLHHGNRRISLVEAEELLRSEGRIKKAE